MKALDRKLVRDLGRMKGQLVAVTLVVACGIATYVTMRSTYESLLVSQGIYYREFRFADIFASLKRAPNSLLPGIRSIDGVSNVRDRIVMEATIDVPGLDEPATGRLVSIPVERRSMLNDLYLREGRYIDPTHPDEVIASEAFTIANHLHPGDSIGAVINGRWRALTIVGVGLSPEYVYEIRGSDVFPDSRRFGILWMSRTALGAAFAMEGAFNDVSISLAPEANSREVISRLDRLLEPYGGTGSYDREEQISHRFLSDEISSDRATGTVIPAIFLGVAAFLIHLVLSRLVQTQRDQIAVLKAFGYTNAAVGRHYLRFAFVTVASGSIVGTATGFWLASQLTELYKDFFHFPIFTLQIRTATVVTAIAISAGAAAIGALLSIRRAVSLPPAEAMRPENPPTFKPGIIETLGLHRYLSVGGRIVLRNLARRRLKAFLSVVGIAMAVSILVVGRYSFDAMEYLMDLQFRVVQREDVTVPFVTPRGPEAKYALADLPGVMEVEPFRAVPVRLRYRHRSRRTALIGLPEDGTLRRLVDDKGRQIDVPPDGLVLNSKLGELLGAGAGDVVTVEVLEESRPTRRIPVTRIVDELIGTSAYMNQDALNRMLEQNARMSGAYLSVDSLRAPSLYARLKRMPAVAGVSIREAMLQSFRDTIAQSLFISNVALIVFACIIAVGVVYNGATIALAERSRELASLRVLGFTRGEVSSILLGEQAVLTAAAVPIGFGIGYGLCLAITRSLSSELYRMPLIVTSRTYAFSFSVVASAAIISSLIVIRRIRHLDLIAVLKTRE